MINNFQKTKLCKRNFKASDIINEINKHKKCFYRRDDNILSVVYVRETRQDISSYRFFLNNNDYVIRAESLHDGCVETLEYDDHDQLVCSEFSTSRNGVIERRTFYPYTGKIKISRPYSLGEKPFIICDSNYNIIQVHKSSEVGFNFNYDRDKNGKKYLSSIYDCRGNVIKYNNEEKIVAILISDPDSILCEEFNKQLNSQILSRYKSLYEL